MNKRQQIKSLRRQLKAAKKDGTTNHTRWFRTAPILGTVPESRGEVDVELGILREVAVVTLGEAKGHGVQLDRAFLSRVVELGNAAAKGLKVRFGHPNASGTALGTFLGRAVNFRVRPDTPDIVRADIHLDETAKDTPNGNLYDYVISMATKNPDMFGTSIVFKPGEDRDPAEINPEDIAFAELPVATMLEFLAVDIVDDPAANEGGLFSRFSAEQIAGRFTSFLDDNPHFWEVIDNHPEVIAPFIERYRAYKNTQTKEVNTMPKEDENKPDTETPEASAPAVEETPETPAETTETNETPEAPQAAAETTEETPEEKPEAVAASNADRVAELGRIAEDYPEVLQEAVTGNLSYDQAGAKVAAKLREENAALRKGAASASSEDAAGAEPLTGGEKTEPTNGGKFSGKLGGAAASRAEYFEKKMSGAAQ